MHKQPQIQKSAFNIGVIGIGYVGLPLAHILSQHFPVVAFDISHARVDALKQGIDCTHELSSEQVKAFSGVFTAEAADLDPCNFFIVTVPTPVDACNIPDLSLLESASRTIGPFLKKGDIVVFESTVYPGATEDVCGPVLEAFSGLVSGEDFFLGYSPERINPGDKVHTIDKIVKVVSGQTPETLKKITSVYETVITAGVHQAPSIKVAESAKVIENTQRDVNIALINEFSTIFSKMGLDTKDVLDAASTKWNFLPFSPGLVGGHCIGVDPYYLTHKAQELGLHPEMILSGRRTNDGMGAYFAQSIMRFCTKHDLVLQKRKVGILGLTFKENCPDLRNSKVIDLIKEFNDFGIETQVCDPVCDADQAKSLYGIELISADEMKKMDVIILAVSHTVFTEPAFFKAGWPHLKFVADLKSCLDKSVIEKEYLLWRP